MAALNMTRIGNQGCGCRYLVRNKPGYFRVLVFLALAIPFDGLAQKQWQPSPQQQLMRINPESLALFRKTESLENAGDFAGVIAVWRERTEAGDDLAQFETSRILLKSPATSPEAARGLDLLRKSAESGYVRAQTRMYFLHRHGLLPLINQDPAQAIAWLRRAAEQDFSVAIVHLGLAYASGIGVERNPKEAFALFQRAAEQNHPFGHFAVGAAHESGIGVSADRDRAREAYEKAIERAIWLDTRPTALYLSRANYKKWISDSKAAIAGLDRPAVVQAPAAEPGPADEARLAGERRKLEEEQAKIADERRRIEAGSARLAAEQRRAAEEAGRRLAAEKRQSDDARLAEAHRRMAAERAKLAEDRRKLEEEQARIAEERRQFEAETERIAAERRRVEAETARIAAERQRVVEDTSRVQPAETVSPSVPAARREDGENDMALNFGQFVKGLATAVRVVTGVAAAVQNVRSGNQAGMTQGVDAALGALGFSGSASPGSGAAGAGGDNPVALLTGVIGAVTQGKTSAERRDLALQALTQTGEESGTQSSEDEPRAGRAKRAKVQGVRLGPSMLDPSSEIPDASDCLSFVRRDRSANMIRVADADVIMQNVCQYPVEYVRCWRIASRNAHCGGRFSKPLDKAVRTFSDLKPGRKETTQIPSYQDPDQMLYAAACQKVPNVPVIIKATFSESAGLRFKCVSKLD